MTIVPETRSEKIMFYQTHLPRWAEDPASIGITPEAVDALQVLVDEARAAEEAHSLATNAARAATMRFHQAVRNMHSGVGGGQYLIQLIKAFASSTDDRSVYARASIDAPASPGRPGSLAAPGKPHSFEVQLLQIGWVKLTWKCDNPHGSVGTLYEIRRQLDAQGPYQFIASVGSNKTFYDESIPAGTGTVLYQVTAIRSTRRGTTADYFFRMGGTQRLPGMRSMNKLAA